jgi:hypothetical protein
MMSPDGKWVWDGQKWIPVAVHESVFPAYTDATAAAATTAAPASPLAETMVSPPVNPFAAQPVASATPFPGPPSASRFVGPPQPAVQSPAIVAPMSYTAGSAAPPWQAWAADGSDRSRMMKLGAAFIALALLVVVAIYFGLSELPFLRASDQPAPTPSPTATPIPPLAARSDFAVAGRYVTSILQPTMASISDPQTHVAQACTGVLSASCWQALDELNNALKPAPAALAASVPACIAPLVDRVRVDLTTIQSGVTKGLAAYTANSTDQLRAGLKTYNLFNRALQTDVAAVVKAQPTCDGQAGGP